MNTTATACPVVEPTFDDAIRERDLGIQRANDAADQWTKNLIDQAILSRIEELGEASMNDCRHLLPEIGNRNLIGARMRVLAATKRIEFVRYVRSTDPGTHAKNINVYRLARP